MHVSLGSSSLTWITARHFAKRAPSVHDTPRAAARSPSRPFGHRLAGTRGQRLGAGVDLDAGHDARAPRAPPRAARRAHRSGGWSRRRGSTPLTKRDEVGRRQQHLAIGAPALRRRRDAERLEPLADGLHRLVGGEDALAGGDERLRGRFEVLVAHVDLLFSAPAARSTPSPRARRGSSRGHSASPSPAGSAGRRPAAGRSSAPPARERRGRARTARRRRRSSRTRAMTRSTRAPICSGVSPPGQPSRKISQPGRFSSICCGVSPSYSP